MPIWDRKHPEREYVTLFIKGWLKKQVGSEIIFHELFTAYKDFMMKTRGGTALDNRSFGKMFHELAKVDRTLMWREKKCQSVIVGWTFK